MSRIVALAVGCVLAALTTAPAHAADEALSAVAEQAETRGPSQGVDTTVRRPGTVTATFDGALPVGRFANETNGELGPSLRVAHFVSPAIAITAGGGLQIGRPRSKSVTFEAGDGGVISKSVSVFSHRLGVRLVPHTFASGGGPYLDADLALNVLFITATEVDVSSAGPALRLGTRARFGWLLSRDVPIELAAEAAMHNLAPQGKKSETAMTVVGLNLGYAFKRW